MSRPSLARATERPVLGGDDELLRRRQAAFEDAARHSKRVYLLRRVLPILAGITIMLVLLWLWIDPLSYLRELPVQVGALRISGTKLTMEAPKLTGFSKDGQPYRIDAEAAAQDLAKPNVIELSGITGKFTDQRGETVLRAANGMYDSKEEKMRLFGDVNIRNEQSNYTAVLKDVIGEPKKGHMVSEKPVTLTFNEGDLRSDRIEIFDHGKSVVFENNVVLNLKSSSLKAKGGAEAAPAAVPKNGAP